MADESPEGAEAPSFSDLTVELIEQTAALVGERVSAPIRTAGFSAARMVALAALLAATAAVGLVFLGVAVGLLVGMAPESSRWWICLLIALGFFSIAAAIGVIAFRRKPEARAGETCEPEE